MIVDVSPVANKHLPFFLAFVTTTVASILILSDPLLALAGMYTYTDAKGIVHYTNVPTDPRYRLMPSILSFSRPLSRSRSRTQLQSYTDRSFDSHIHDAAQRYDIDPLLIKAVIKQESNFNPNATSGKGALGLMQLMPGTARDMGVYDVFDPRDNIFGGVRYLRRLYSQFNGDLALTLASYNAGPERVYAAANTIPDIPETRDYVRSVLSMYNSYKHVD